MLSGNLAFHGMNSAFLLPPPPRNCQTFTSQISSWYTFKLFDNHGLKILYVKAKISGLDCVLRLCVIRNLEHTGVRSI